jgi:outer membrane lipoprotein carrier protein
MLSYRRVELLAAVGLTGALAAGAATLEAPATEAARRIEERHRRIVDLRARFVQTYRSGILGREVVERGSVSLKRPGRMLWEYRDPERKTFVCDGKSCYFYVPADKQVFVRDQAGQRGVAVELLAGQLDILERFEVSLESGPDGRGRLLLVPRRPDPEVERLYVEADAEGRIQALEIQDAQGNRSRFRFDSVQENVGLSDNLFRFQIPEGVEVFTG